MYVPIASMARALVRGWYRCEHYGPPLAEGPLVLIGNHSNGLADAGLLVLRTRRPLRFLAKIGLVRMPVLGWLVRRVGAIRIFRQKDGEGTEQNVESFAAAFDALERGEIVVLFPEGTSHSDPRLRPFRTGAARIALGAEARRGFRVGARIQPVAIHYEDRAGFRSLVQTWSGEPIALDGWAERTARDPRRAARDLTRRLEAAVGELVPAVRDARERELLWFAERLAPDDGDTPPSRRVRLARALDALDSGRPALVARLDRLERDRARAGLGSHARSTGPLALVALTLGVAVLLPAWLPPGLAVRTAARVAPVPVDKLVTVQLLAAWLFVPLWLVGVGAAGAAAAGPAGAAAALAATLASGLLLLRAWPAWKAAWHGLAAAGVRAPDLSSRTVALRDELGGLLGVARDPEGTSDPLPTAP